MILIDRQQYPAEKRVSGLGLDSKEQKRIYYLPIQVTGEIKLSMFQCKIIHNIHKNPYCPYCINKGDFCLIGQSNLEFHWLIH